MQYRKAIGRGSQAAAVFNNFGYSLMQLNQLDEARDCLQRAIAADEQLAPAYYTLVRVYLKQDYSGRSVTSSELALARKALEICPPSTDLYRDAAALHARAAIRAQTEGQRRDLENQARDCLDQAVQHGLNAETLDSDPDFLSLSDSDRSHQRLRQPVGSLPSTKIDRLIPPY